jgi:methyltransferase (TIGR00027 family)
MEEGKHSVTADDLALRRVIHWLIDRPLVFDDPIAIRLLSPQQRDSVAAIARGPRPVGSGALRALAAARSRFCEDALASAVNERDIRQYVILGAGFDTFAYRSPLALRMRVFEVDFPASQSLKRLRLSEAGIAEPPSLTFVPVDLEKASLIEALVRAGVKTSEPAFFGALGLVVYLKPATLRDMFGMIATAFPQGSEIAFDYVVSRELTSERSRQVHEQLFDRLGTLGEPVRSLIIPSELKRTLLGLGFHDVEHLDDEAINGRYFFARGDGLKTHRGCALARAAV